MLSLPWAPEGLQVRGPIWPTLMWLVVVLVNLPLASAVPWVMGPPCCPLGPEWKWQPEVAQPSRAHCSLPS